MFYHDLSSIAPPHRKAWYNPVVITVPHPLQDFFWHPQWVGHFYLLARFPPLRSIIVCGLLSSASGSTGVAPDIIVVLCHPQSIPRRVTFMGLPQPAGAGRDVDTKSVHKPLFVPILRIITPSINWRIWYQLLMIVGDLFNFRKKILFF